MNRSLVLTLASLTALFACEDGGAGGRDAALDGAVEPVDSADAVDATADADTHGDGSADAGLHPLCDAVEGLCDPLPDGVRVGEPVVIAPSDGLPAEFVSQKAHNNLDVTWHDGRLYAAIRTAPSHFAGPDTVMYLISSPDLQTWRYEGEVAIGTDVREPQLVSWQGRLWFYYAILGDNPFEFEPQGVERIEYLAPGQWTEPEPAFAEGLIPWRFKEIDGRLHMIGYVGGENVYDNDQEGLATYWLASDDGDTFEPAFDDPIIRVSGASETDFAFLDDGSLVAVARNEAGDETGFGSHICTAPADALADWTCDADLRKYDSPLMLSHDGQPWLIGRRNVSETGNYDLQLDDLDPEDQFLRYQVDYWSKPKRCSLWRVDAERRTVALEADLPSRGDTCFPEAIPLGEGRFLVFNYSSPFDGEDVAWQVGQGGETWVYYVVVQL